MIKYKFYFLASASILIFMGALLKLEHKENYNASLIGGIVNIIVFVVLFFVERKRVKA